MPPDKETAPTSWSIDEEIIAFVEMAKAQVAIALREAEGPIAELGSFVADMGSVAARLEALAARAAADPRDDLAAVLSAEAAAIAGHARGGSVALQFHDRLVQRMTHAHEALEVLAGAVADRHKHRRPADWERLRQQIRARYSMEQERVIFDLLVGGASAEHVVNTLKNMREAGSPGHVDLF